MSTNQDIILTGYNQMWNTGRADLLRGYADADPVPDATSKRWGISAVLHLPISYGDFLSPTVDDLKDYIGDQHTFYNPNTFHVTLRSIEFFRLSVGVQDEAVSRYSLLLRQLAYSIPPLKIAFKGLSANRVGVILQGYPVDNQLQDLRQRFHQLLETNQLLQGPEAIQPRFNAHASLAVFGGPLKDAVSLVNYVERHRNTDYNQVTVKQVDLVRYERTPTQVNLIPLEHITFNLTT